MAGKNTASRRRYSGQDSILIILEYHSIINVEKLQLWCANSGCNTRHSKILSDDCPSMQKVEACVSFSSQTNYINTKKKLPCTILALHCSVEPEVLHEMKKKNYFIEYLRDTFSGHFDVVNLAANQ